MRSIAEKDLDRRGDRLPDEPAGAERGDRGRAGGRPWPGLRGRRDRGAQARRAQPGRGPGDRRSRGDVGQGGRGVRELLAALVPRSGRRRTSSRKSPPPPPSSPRAWRRSPGSHVDQITQRNASSAEELSSTAERWRARPTRCAGRPRPSSRRPRACTAWWRSSARTRPRPPLRRRPRRPRGSGAGAVNRSGAAGRAVPVVAYAATRRPSAMGGAPEREFRRF